MNEVILKGRLTAKPELKRTTSDIFVTDFCIAVKRKFGKDQVDFINIQAWRQTAEFVSKYFNKGQEIVVVGELHIEKWDKDGETRTTSRVVADYVDFCGSKSDNAEQMTSADSNNNEFVELPQSEADDLPF